MKRKTKTVTWKVKRDRPTGWYLVHSRHGQHYELISLTGWHDLMCLFAICPGQSATLKVTVEVV